MKLHRDKQEPCKRKAGDLWQNSDYVFTNAIGEHEKPVNILTRFKRIVDKIGAPSARFHDLRHTYAVSALQAGDDPKTVSENLGHATVAFTLDVYGHVTEQMKHASANRMENYINSIQ